MATTSNTQSNIQKQRLEKFRSLRILLSDLHTAIMMKYFTRMAHIVFTNVIFVVSQWFLKNFFFETEAIRKRLLVPPSSKQSKALPATVHIN